MPSPKTNLLCVCYVRWKLFLLRILMREETVSSDTVLRAETLTTNLQ